MGDVEKAVNKMEKTEMRNTEKTVAKQVIETDNIRLIVKKRKVFSSIPHSKNSDGEEESVSNDKGNICHGCIENYSKTRLMEDWLQCVL